MKVPVSRPREFVPLKRLVTACFLGGLIALASALSSCAPPDAGRLVVYTAGPRPLAEAICKAFEAAHGVRVELFTATTGQIMAKLEAEKYNPRADVVILAGETAALGLKQ
ncbi:MAG: substrate-binding domain-containing protein, partial [Verrucomicrobiia bacterium]